MSAKKRTLHLSLKKEPFEVMVTGEKRLEFRTPGTWILSRLVNKQYDTIKFTNGYGPEKPYFIAEFSRWWVKSKTSTFTYSNGLSVTVKQGMVVISLGAIIERGNI